MNKEPLHVTHDELLRAIINQCADLAFTPDETAAYLLAQETNGVLRPTVPNWIRASTLFRIQRGEGPDVARLEEHRRTCSAMAKLAAYRQGLIDASNA
jgi:hypothetical protein